MRVEKNLGCVRLLEDSSSPMDIRQRAEKIGRESVYVVSFIFKKKVGIF